MRKTELFAAMLLALSGLIAAAPPNSGASVTQASDTGVFVSTPHDPAALRAASKSQTAKRPAPNLLQYAGAIVRARLGKMQHEYTEQTGPREVYPVTGFTVLVGAVPESLYVSRAGGPLPDGRVLSVSDQPDYQEGEEYLIVYSNRPLGSGHVLMRFRIVAVAGKGVAVSDEGLPLLGWADDRPLKGSVSLYADQGVGTLVADPASILSSAPVAVEQIAEDLAASARARGASLVQPVSLQHPPGLRWDRASTTKESF